MGTQANQTLVARARRVSATAGAVPYAKAHGSGLNQPAVGRGDPPAHCWSSWRAEGGSCFVESHSAFFFSSPVLPPPYRVLAMPSTAQHRALSPLREGAVDALEPQG